MYWMTTSLSLSVASARTLTRVLAVVLARILHSLIAKFSGFQFECLGPQIGHFLTLRQPMARKPPYPADWFCPLVDAGR